MQPKTETPILYPHDQKHILTLDFETYFDRQYSLKKMTTGEYINDPRFQVLGYSIQVNNNQPTYYHTGSSEPLFATVARLGGWDKVLLLGQNTRFDAMICITHFGVPRDVVVYGDTRSMLAGTFPGYPADLASGAERMFPNDKAMRKGKELESFEGLTREEIASDPALRAAIEKYCNQDVWLTYHIYKALLPFYPDEELDLIHLNIRMFAEPSFLLDESLARAEIEQTDREVKAKVEASGYQKKQLSSNPQFAAIVESLGVEVPTKASPTTGKPIPALGKNDLQFMELQSAHPEHAALWEARTAVKSTIGASRAQRFIDLSRAMGGLMPIALNYYGANTGRYSGAEKLNQQNLPRIDKRDPDSGRLRRSLLAPEGEVTLVADSSNIEARMLAWVADYAEELEIYANDGDVYRALAAKIYNKHVDEIPESGGERNVGKVSRLGLGYGMGKDKFWYTMNTGPMGMPPIRISRQEAEYIVHAFRSSAYPIPKFWRTCEHLIERMLDRDCDYVLKGMKIRHQCIVLPNGMALRYDGLRAVPHAMGVDYEFWNGRGYYSKLYGGLLTENIVQALARIVVTDQMRDIEFLIHPLGGRVVHMVHDEVIAHVPEKYADEAMAHMINAMSVPPDWCKDLPVKAEGGYAREYSK